MPRKSPASKYVDVATGVRLSSHEKLCAERMNNILKALEETQKEIKTLRADINKGKGALWVLLVISGIVTGAFNYFS
jgi:hypothetical protein